MEINEGIRKLIHDQASEDELVHEARKNSNGLLQNGFERVKLGETTIDEVFRVTQS